MNQEQRSKHWNELVEILEQEFPKGECQERGQAMVLLAYAEMALLKEEKALAEQVRAIEDIDWCKIHKTMHYPTECRSCDIRTQVLSILKQKNEGK